MRWILGTALIATFAFSGQVRSQECAITIEVSDLIEFPIKQMTVSKSCESFELTLKHTGSLAATIMGHNWVLAKTEDYQAVAVDGMSAGADNNYLKPDDPRVLAATKIIGGGEETSISFDPSTLEAGGDYTFFCSFLGHYAAMNGKLIVE